MSDTSGMAVLHAHRASSHPFPHYIHCAAICNTDITLTVQPHACRMLIRRRTITHGHGADHEDEEAISAAAHVITVNRKHKKHLHFLCIRGGRTFYLYLDLFLLASPGPPILIYLFFLQDHSCASQEWRGSQWEQPSNILTPPKVFLCLLDFNYTDKWKITFAIHTLCQPLFAWALNR